MKVFLDTNVLVAAVLRQHPHFNRADAAMRRCLDREDDGLIHAHSVLEFHSALTQLPKGLAVPPSQVELLLARGILPFVRCVALAPNEVCGVQRVAAAAGLVGGIIYDFYHLAVAQREAVDRLYTFNVPHFQRLAPEPFRDRIAAP